jgi:hypothetical protein
VAALSVQGEETADLEVPGGYVEGFGDALSTAA